uniref:hypothetical protein n=1 Tax=Synarthrophyton patena TaxID=48972 RepID=UPI002182099A|nr:hypothetical protein N4M48_pgp059 [Synarthrophyton patena]UVF62962.1 hypothetical protein [Synarthrophyton patena]
MNLSQLSNNYQFLYSPKSWLHMKNTNYKIYYVFMQLIILPYTHFKYIIVIFIITLMTLKSIYLPIKVREDIFFTTIFFAFALIANSYYTTKNMHINNIDNYILKIQPLNFIYRFLKVDNSFIKNIANLFFCISIATSRLIFISLTHIITIKIFLLTTDYEKIIISLSKYRNNYIVDCDSKIQFIIILSSQFLKITFIQINRIKTACLIRGTNYQTINLFKRSMLIYFFLTKRFLMNFYKNIQFISKTLYSRNISNKDLYIINIYNK